MRDLKSAWALWLLGTMLGACQGAGITRPSPVPAKKPPAVISSVDLRLPPLNPPDPEEDVTFPLPPEWTMVSISRGEERFFEILVGAFVGRMTPRGKVAVPVRYHELYEYGHSSEGRYLLSIQGRRWGPIQRWGGLKGIISDRGKTILPNRYQSVSEPFEDRIEFMIGGHFGYTDGRGRPAIPALFDGARRFADDRACVNVGGRQYAEDWIPDYVVGGKWGFIDRYGRWVVPPTLDACTRYYGGLAPVQVGCKESTVSEHARECYGGTWGLLDVRGRWVLEPRFSSIKVLGDIVSESNAPWVIPDVRNPEFLVCLDCGAYPHPACGGKPGRVCGRMGAGGKWLHPLKRDFPVKWDNYRYGRRYKPAAEKDPPGPYKFGEEDYGHDGDNCSRYTAPDVIVGPDNGACRRITRVGGTFTCIGKDGRTKLLPEVETVEAYNGPLAPVRIRGRWGFIDGDGRVAVEPNIEAGRVFARLCHLSLERDDQGRLLFFRQTVGRMGLLNTTGAFRPGWHGDRDAPVSEERVVPNFEDLAGNYSRYPIVEDHRDVNSYDWESDDRSTAKLEKRYEEVKSFGWRRYRVKVGGRYGLVDEAGKILLPAVHRELRRLNEDLVGVCRGVADNCRDPANSGWRMRRLETLEELPGVYADLRPASEGFVLFAVACREQPGRTCLRRYGVMDPDGVVVLRRALDVPADAEVDEEYVFEFPAKLPAPFSELLERTGPWAVAGTVCRPATEGRVCDRTGILAFTGAVVFGPQAMRIVTTGMWSEHRYPLGCSRGGPIDRGTIRVADAQGRHGLVSPDMRVLVPLRYDLVCTPDQGVARVMTIDDMHPNRLFGAWGLVAVGGPEILPPVLGYISSFHRGVARVNDGGICYSGSALRCKGGLWGLVDRAGRDVVPPQYDGIGPFDGDVARVYVHPRFSLLPVPWPAAGRR